MATWPIRSVDPVRSRLRRGGDIQRLTPLKHPHQAKPSSGHASGRTSFVYAAEIHPWPSIRMSARYAASTARGKGDQVRRAVGLPGGSDDEQRDGQDGREQRGGQQFIPGAAAAGDDPGPER